MKNVPISKSIPYNIDENYLELTRKVHLILHVGRLMMENSADTSRIVRTMQRTAAYAGIFGDQLHIHVTYTTLMVSVSVGNYHMTKLQKCYQHNVDMGVFNNKFLCFNTSFAFAELFYLNVDLHIIPLF